MLSFLYAYEKNRNNFLEEIYIPLKDTWDFSEALHLFDEDRRRRTLRVTLLQNDSSSDPQQQNVIERSKTDL